MKYALCISGFMRGFRQSINSLKRAFLDEIDCDVFISTWDIVGHSHFKKSSPIFNRQPEERLTYSMIEEVYGPWLKGCNITSFDMDKIMPEWIEKKPIQKRIVSMYYHINKANKLKIENGTKYDLTIRCRSDLFFETNISKKLEEEALAQKLQYPHIDKRVFLPAVESFHNLTNDQFMFGATPVMDVVAKIYESIATPRAFWCADPAEKTLEHYLAKNKIIPSKFIVKYKRNS